MRTSLAENAILDAWRETVARRGDSPAILDEAGRVCRTFAELEAEAAALALDFREIEEGSVVGVQIGNDVRWPALLLALIKGGVIPLPLGRHIEAAELDAALESCRAAGLFTIEGGELSFRTMPVRNRPEWDGRAPNLLKLTSGTSSAPRAIRFHASQLVADCDNICASMGITARDLNYGVIPFSHSYGFSNLITPLLCRGVTLVASEDRIPRAIVNGIAASGATVFPGMPIFFDKLAGLDGIPELPRLRLCISAGAPLTRSAGERFTARYGLKIHTFYGSSECGGIGYDCSEEPCYEDGYVGTPMDGVGIERIDGSTGRIAVRSAAVGDGYFPDTDCEVLGNGEFRPGDLIRWDDRGMWIAGRVSDVINVAGRKLNPAEVEARVQLHPGVRGAIVFGVTSPLRGEEPVLCVEGKDLERADLTRYCRANLSEWQMPRDIWIVSEIPVNERGKISRRQLAERYLAARS